MSARRLFQIITVLAVLGILVSGLSLQHHYAKSRTSYCDFGQNFNCDIVNRSEYSTIAGIPVAGIGAAGYLVLLAFATLYRDKAETPALLTVMAAGGLAFALYLTYVEHYILQAWCILCLSSLVLVVLIAVASAVLLRQTMRSSAG
jgi:vitamin-K-epoxide reductase (warfarin-sensitive)